MLSSLSKEVANLKSLKPDDIFTALPTNDKDKAGKYKLTIYSRQLQKILRC